MTMSTPWRGAPLIGALTAVWLLGGCSVLQSLEPVMEAPVVYQGDAAVKVEFIHPDLVGLRCAERGVTFFGLPGLNSMACADPALVSVANPCFVVNGGWYAKALCHELGHVNGWGADHKDGTYFAQRDPKILPARLSPEALAEARREAQTQDVAARSGLTVAAAADVPPLLASAFPDVAPAEPPATQLAAPSAPAMAALAPEPESHPPVALRAPTPPVVAAVTPPRPPKLERPFADQSRRSTVVAAAPKTAPNIPATDPRVAAFERWRALVAPFGATLGRLLAPQ